MYARIALGLCLVGALAWAQGTKPTIAEQLRGGSANQQVRQDAGITGSAGPGYIQQDFLQGLQGGLNTQFGDARGGEMFQNLQEQEVKPDEMTKLINGQTPNSDLAKLFGASPNEVEGVSDVVDDAVDRKNMKLFCGILVVVIVVDCEMMDEGFLEQMCKGMEGMSSGSFEKLLRGDVSTSTIQEGFGFDDKSMCKQMQEFLNKMKESPYVNHPLCESLGMGKTGKFDPGAFPKPAEGMPGFGGDFAGGTAGGMPFDMKLPPCPFAGENMGFSFACCGDKPAGGEDAPSGE